MSTTNQNGARAKILRALAEYGLMPVLELAAAACLSPSQARDNANHAVTNWLVTKCRDDITNTLAYKITAAVRGYLAERIGVGPRAALCARSHTTAGLGGM